MTNSPSLNGQVHRQQGLRAVGVGFQRKTPLRRAWNGLLVRGRVPSGGESAGDVMVAFRWTRPGGTGDAPAVVSTQVSGQDF